MKVCASNCPCCAEWHAEVERLSKNFADKDAAWRARMEECINLRAEVERLRSAIVEAMTELSQLRGEYDDAEGTGTGQAD